MTHHQRASVPQQAKLTMRTKERYATEEQKTALMETANLLIEAWYSDDLSHENAVTIMGLMEALRETLTALVQEEQKR